MGKQSLNHWQGRRMSGYYWLAVGFGSGLLRPAPGTWGTIPGLVIAYILMTTAHTDLITTFGAPQVHYIFWTLFVFMLGLNAVNFIEGKTNIHDAPEIVIDEWVGIMIAAAPLMIFPWGWLDWVLAFILFRIFDIVKPWPISWLDAKVKGGFGVMIDDVVAGIQAAVVLYALLYFNVFQMG